jgi:hypothetical protein
MPVLNEIAAKLEAVGLGTQTVDIFVGRLEAEPDVQIAVATYGGLAPEFGFGTAGVKYETPAVQIRVRGVEQDLLGPMARAKTAHDELAKVEATALSGVFYHWIHPQQPPFELERDQKGRVIVAFNCLCEKEPS